MTRTIDDWLDRLDLKRDGTEWKGPCPSCGGDDRFHLKPGGKYGVLIGCRGCIDHLSAGVKKAAYLKIVTAVFGTDRPLERPKRDWRLERARIKHARERAIAAAGHAHKMIREAKVLPHPYLAAKGFEHRRGLVLDDLLLIPARDEQGRLLSLQTISADGEKLYLPGGRMKGARLHLGRERERWICEGYATALSVQAALNMLSRRASVVMAFSAGNLRQVAREGDRIVADHDESGAGERFARATGLPYWMPPEPGDANDWHQRKGLPALVYGLRTLL